MTVHTLPRPRRRALRGASGWAAAWCALIALLLAAPLAGQPAPAPGPAQAQPIEAQQPARVISSAETEQAEEDYRGPTILGRGGRATVARESNLTFKPFLSLLGVYDTNLAAVGVDSQGKWTSADAFGGEAVFGVRGARRWSHSEVDLDYRGSMRAYQGDSYYDGSDHTLTLGYERQLGPHWGFRMDTSAATFSRGFFLSNALGQNYDPTFGNLTANELFDSRTSAAFGSGKLIRQQTARLSFALGASGYLVRRRSAALIGLNGFTGMADVAYRVSRHSTIGVNYTYSRFDFSNSYGESEIHGVGLTWQTRLTRRWELALGGGGFQVRTNRLALRTIDPALALILGRNQIVEIFRGTTYSPQAQAHLTYSFRSATLTIQAGRTVSPGNGVLLTAVSDTGGISFNYRASRRVSFSFDAGASRYRALSQTMGRYLSYHGGGGLSVRVLKSLSLLARAGARSYEIQNSSLDRNSYRLSVGLGWEPGDYPLSLW